MTVWIAEFPDIPFVRSSQLVPSRLFINSTLYSRFVSVRNDNSNPFCIDTALKLGGGSGPMVNVRVALPVPPRLLALIVTGKFPCAEGVPKMRPAAGSKEIPAGKPIAKKLVGLFDAVIW